MENRSFVLSEYIEVRGGCMGQVVQMRGTIRLIR
jgi:hypothetical protein